MGVFPRLVRDAQESQGYGHRKDTLIVQIPADCSEWSFTASGGRGMPVAMSGPVLSGSDLRLAAPDQSPVDVLIAAWERHLKGLGRGGPTIARLIGTVRKVARECLWKVKGDLRQARLVEWLNDRRIAGGSVLTYNSDACTFRGFGAWLVLSEHLTDNPFAGIPRAKGARGRGSRAFTADEVWQLVVAAGRVGNEPGRERSRLYAVLFLTGLRRGEMGKVEVADVDLGRAILNLREEAATQKSCRARVIPLYPLAIDLLRMQIAGKAPGAKLFHIPEHGTFLTDCERAGFDRTGRQMGFHSFRKGLATVLDAARVPTGAVAAMLGHVDANITARHYQETDANHVLAAMGVLVPKSYVDAPQIQVSRQKIVGIPAQVEGGDWTVSPGVRDTDAVTRGTLPHPEPLTTGGDAAARVSRPVGERRLSSTAQELRTTSRSSANQENQDARRIGCGSGSGTPCLSGDGQGAHGRGSSGQGSDRGSDVASGAGVGQTGEGGSGAADASRGHNTPVATDSARLLALLDQQGQTLRLLAERLGGGA